MSINSMANAAASRRPDIAPLNVIPRGLDEIARAAASTPTPTASTSSDQAPPTTPMDTALNVLFGYIPTEILTLYVAVLAAVQQVSTTSPAKVTPAAWITFYSFLIATPVVVWLMYGAKLIAAKKSVPWQFSKWPVWEMFAATVAYCAWAFALPNSQFMEFTWYSASLSGVVVLVVSTILGLLAPFFQRPLAGDAPPSGN